MNNWLNQDAVLVENSLSCMRSKGSRDLTPLWIGYT